MEQNYKVSITLSRAYELCLACQHLPLCNLPHVGIGTASHVSMRLVLVGDSFISKGSLGATLIGPSAPTRFLVGKIGANQV